MKPLEGIIVLEFAQFMAGPSAGLRLADLGARVIKIERPVHGEAGRQIALKNLFLDNSSLVFHTVNRNKESYAADLKSPEDLECIKKLIQQADVMTHNFRPGVMEKIGLDYEKVKMINPQMIYATVTGYGTKGPWVKKPGQDLLIQSMSGFVNLSGNKNDDPVPVGAAVSDIITGSHLSQGILAALFKRIKTNQGSWVEVSLLESTLDLQFESLTTFLNDGNKKIARAEKGSAQPYLGAPYGVYKTKKGFISLAMGSLLKLGEVIGCAEISIYTNSDAWFTKRNDIMEVLETFLINKTTQQWLDILEPAGIWASAIYNYSELLEDEGYKILKMDQKLKLLSGEKVHTLRCPIRLNDKRIFSERPAPRVGQHTEDLKKEFNL
ncbi:CaiB/BaiF CoA transferase family protein [Flavobacterium saccharophilum]|uniref:Crotonobetainyl-CoA:carnitine CoA-transferase CaiB n=1 Tax=Flavobacterium saccharophilum TaxID=29534 RepID=A0A1M7JIQ6_9FLAO|nr:CoA transferase [Flavobacterium saccharophilum]SHM52781.1 Crotonobetainyl-CoA:carnitine CoA-transferase CaiB [Flavobacterium saccharophilum]